MDIVKSQKLIKCFDFYGKMLTQNQQEILGAYLNFDNTITEIANERKISRQAVFLVIANSIERLNKMEGKLGFVEKSEKNSKALLILKEMLTRDGLLKYAKCVEDILKIN